MPCVRILAFCCCAFLSTNEAAAQTFAETLDVASAKIEARDWQAAADLLLALAPEQGSTAEQERLAAELTVVGESLLRALQPELALRAHERARMSRRLVHAEADDLGMARSLNDIAACMRTLGRMQEALQHYELAVAMHRRLAKGQDSAVFAIALNSLGSCQNAIGRHEEGLQNLEAALAMRLRLFGDRDDAAVARSINNVGSCLRSLGRFHEAKVQFEAALAMRRRLAAGRDDAEVAASMVQIASCLEGLGHADEALPLLKDALAMRQRMFAERDHPDVAESWNSLGACLLALGRPREALPNYEAALAMRQRRLGDHQDVAISLNNVAACQLTLGDTPAALRNYEAALAMRLRVFGDIDQEHIAANRCSLALCLQVLGRMDEALPQQEAALAMRRRLFTDHDHADVAGSLNNLATCYRSLGRTADALPLLEAALAMQQRLLLDHDHADQAACHENLAACLEELGRPDEAVRHHEAALAMLQRLFPDADHPLTATCLVNLAGCMDAQGHGEAAVAQYEAALAMQRRLFAGRDHPDQAETLTRIGNYLLHEGRAEAARPRLEAALAMTRRLFGDCDHPDVATNLDQLATCMHALGQDGPALALATEACDMIDRLRERSQTSPDLRQSLFDKMKHNGAFEHLQLLAMRQDAPAALATAERSRGRDLLDLLQEQRIDPLEQIERRAAADGDEKTAGQVQRLRTELAAAALEDDVVLHLLTQLDDDAIDAPAREVRRTELVARSRTASEHHLQLANERARRIGAELPLGRVCSAAEIRSVLQPGELLLEYTITKDAALLYLVAPDQPVQAIELPTAFAALGRALPIVLACGARAAPAARRGRDPDATVGGGDVIARAGELFASLVPASVWQRVRGSKRVFVAAHRALHRLPFELLVTAIENGKPVYWLESGPAISYVPSGSSLHWLRQREAGGRDDSPRLDLLTIGDPGGPPPAQATAAPRVADAAARGKDTALELACRSGDLERIRKLPPLSGAAAEARAIAAAWSARGRAAKCLLGAEATEPAVFDLAGQTRFLHFACHGIAEEYAGQSLSMLVLSQPRQVLPEDDGLLKLGDLLHRWRGHLTSCRLVVLSACRTNVGPTLRDEAPQALPIGFLFAGAKAVVCSLWAVDDDSTRELMTDFYDRLLAGETDRLAAFAAARKALRQKYPDPFHWAPFLYVGNPE